MFKEVIAVVLAAEQCHRFNGDKRLASYGSSTLLQASLIPLFKRFRMVYVVIRPEDDPALLFGPYLPYVHLIRSEHCTLGIGNTIADAINAIRDVPATACAICLGNMPELKTTTIQDLIGHATETTIVRPQYQGKQGYPVLVGHQMWSELTQLKDGIGLDEIIEQHASVCTIVDIEDAGVLFNIDTPTTTE